jgi:predicted ABC-type exoprotein transport system permease subunit
MILHNYKRHYLYVWIIIVMVLKSNMLRWAEHVARVGRTRNSTYSSFGAEAPRKATT